MLDARCAMRRAKWLLSVIALAASAGLAQTELPPSAQDGPMNIQQGPPKPDKDGVYAVTPGITPPTMVHAEPAVYPADAPVVDHPIPCMLSAVVGVDGKPRKVEVVRGCNGEFAAPAIDAVEHSQFRPGSLNDMPVPVLVHLRVGFRPGEPSALPRLALFFGAGDGGFHPRTRQWDKPPESIYAPIAPFSEEARRRKIQGVVIVSLMVTEDGLPTDLHVEKSVGAGLDEKALESISQYRFKPAMKDGKPVAARISVEVSFRLY